MDRIDRMKTKKHEKTNIRNYEIHEKTRKKHEKNRKVRQRREKTNIENYETLEKNEKYLTETIKSPKRNLHG